MRGQSGMGRERFEKRKVRMMEKERRVTNSAVRKKESKGERNKKQSEKCVHDRRKQENNKH